MMIGAGRQQEASPTFWQVTVNAGPDNDVWTELAYPNPNINAAGFKTTSTRVPRWGENNVSDASEFINYGAGNVQMYVTTFNGGARTHEAQAVNGDSGGAVFLNDGGNWYLSGMMLTVSIFENQPSGTYTAVLGNETYSADLSYYSDEILTITGIPETASSSLAILSIAGICLKRRRSLALHPRQNP
jgi:hypothetical protein